MRRVVLSAVLLLGTAINRTPCRESSADIWHVHHDDCVRSGRQVSHAILEPRSLTVCSALHALAAITEFSLRSWIRQLCQAHGLERAVCRAG